MVVFQDTWLWQAAIYLFLGGLSAGTFFIAGLICICGKRRLSKVYRISFRIAPALLAIGLAFLLIELVKPTRTLIFWQSFSNTSSWMLWGAWVALGCVIVFRICAVFETPGPSGWLRDLVGRVPYLREILRRVFVGVGLLGALFVTVYTGMLLKQATGVPFWSSPLLPALFCVSAIDAGLGMVVIVSVATGRMDQVEMGYRRQISVVGLILTVVQTVIMFAYLYAMSRGLGFEYASQAQAAVASAEALISGGPAALFWTLVSGLGLGVPISAFIVGLARNEGIPNAVLLISAVLTIVGDATLRFLIVYAGAYADYFAMVLAGIG